MPRLTLTLQGSEKTQARVTQGPPTHRHQHNTMAEVATAPAPTLTPTPTPIPALHLTGPKNHLQVMPEGQEPAQEQADMGDRIRILQLNLNKLEKSHLDILNNKVSQNYNIMLI